MKNPVIFRTVLAAKGKLFMLQRDTNQALVAGVAAGLSEKYNLNVWVVRLMFVASFFLLGLGLAVYWWLWIDETANSNQIRMNF